MVVTCPLTGSNATSTESPLQLLLSTFTSAIERMRLAGADHAVLRTREGIAHLEVSGRDSLPSSSSILGPCDSVEERITGTGMLTDVARSLSAASGPDATVHLDFEDVAIIASCGRTRARIATGDASPDEAQIPRLDGESFEWTPAVASAFRQALRFTQNDNDTVLGQVHVEPGWVVATDSFTLLARRTSEQLPRMYLPAVVTLLAKQFRDGAMATLDKDRLQFEDELGRAVVPLYAGGHQFPSAWKNLVDMPDDGWLEVDRKELLGAINAATVRGSTNVVLEVRGDEIAVRGRSPENGWIEQTIDGFGQTTSGEDIAELAIRFNAAQLSRCVSTIEFEGPLRIRLRPLTATKPHQGFTAISNAGTTVLVQPLRSEA